MIKVEKVKDSQGWRYTLTDDVNKEVWVGDYIELNKKGLVETIQNFIRDRKQRISTLQEQIKEAEKL